MTIGERIKARREKLGLSVTKLAQILNKDRTTVYRYESNYIEELPISVVEPLAFALQTTPAYLMGWVDDLSNEQLDVLCEIAKKDGEYKISALHDYELEEKYPIVNFLLNCGVIEHIPMVDAPTQDGWYYRITEKGKAAKQAFRGDILKPNQVVAIAKGGDKVQYDLSDNELQAILTLLDSMKKSK